MKKVLLATLICLMPTPFVRGADEWATLKVKIVVDGAVPEPAIEETSKKDPFCGPLNVKSQKMLVHGKEQALENLVIFMDMRASRKSASDIHPDLKNPPADQPVLDNKGCVFVPHILFVRAGQSVKVTNTDQVGHNAAFTFFNPDNVGVNQQIPAGGFANVQINAAEPFPMPVNCGAHPWMGAHLVIQDHPYVGISSDSGEIQIEKLPAGKVAFKVWHEVSALVREFKLDGKAVSVGRSGWEVELKPGVNDVGIMTIDAKAFNK